MALDRERLIALAERTTGHYRDAQLAILTLLARYAKRGMGSEECAARMLDDSPRLRRDLQRVIARLQSDRACEVASALGASYDVSASDATRALSRAGLIVSIGGGSPALTALTRELQGRLAAGDLRILRVSEDVFRSVIGAATSSSLTGDLTRRAAAQAALDAFAARGVTGFVDGAGRSWNLASYAEMACRTAVMSAARLGRFAAMRAAGQDLAIVSMAPNPCEDCAAWEGQVISLDGVTPGYPTLADVEGGHLFGPNCGHLADPYVPGLTEVQSAPTADPEAYAAREQQRYLERGVRAWKLRQAAALDDAASKAAGAKVRDWQARLREHVVANGLKRLSDREQIGKAI